MSRPTSACRSGVRVLLVALAITLCSAQGARRHNANYNCQGRPTLTCFLATTNTLDANGAPSVVAGRVDLTPTYDANSYACRTRINGTVTGLFPAAPHAWHIHQFGDISNSAGNATGPHYNPSNTTHGIPAVDRTTHAGDLGNITPNSAGIAVVNILSAVDTMLVIGRGLIIHAKPDGGAQAQPAGNAGARLAQCVLGRIDAGLR